MPSASSCINRFVEFTIPCFNVRVINDIVNKPPFFILSAFILGVVATFFFVNVVSVNEKFSYSADSHPFLASVVGSVTTPDLTASTTSAVSASTTLTVCAAPTVCVLPTPPVATSTLQKKYEYKLLRDVDLCTMNKLGTQGWQAYQFGGTLDSAYGSDESCKNWKMYDVLDWVLFSRDNTQ